MSQNAVNTLVPIGMQYMGHLVVGLLFLLWWMTRYVGDPDEPIRAERLPLVGVSDAVDQGAGNSSAKTLARRRRYPVTLIALVAVAVVGTGIPILTAVIAARSPTAFTQAPPPTPGNPEQEVDQ